jgi:hypothetical protein
LKTWAASCNPGFSRFLEPDAIVSFAELQLLIVLWMRAPKVGLVNQMAGAYRAQLTRGNQRNKPRNVSKRLPRCSIDCQTLC